MQHPVTRSCCECPDSLSQQVPAASKAKPAAKATTKAKAATKATTTVKKTAAASKKKQPLEERDTNGGDSDAGSDVEMNEPVSLAGPPLCVCAPRLETLTNTRERGM